jgi:hypothetical protein
MTEHQGVSRRNFLKVATVTAVAAAATGGGAALLKQAAKPVVISSDTALPPATNSLPTIPPPAPAAAVNQPVAYNTEELFAQLAQSQAENMQLRSHLDSMQRELAALQMAEQDNRLARETMTMELDSTRNKLGVLGGLVALYEQLDTVDVGSAIENGLNTVGGKINELLGSTPDLVNGLERGQLALSQIESHIPLLDSGRQWLDVQVNKLQGFHAEVESWLQRAVDRAGDFLQLLSEWFAGVRRWLPFGMGEKAAGVMGALTTLLAETPATVSGLDTNIAQPLDVWLSRIDGEPALQRLLRPVRDEVFVKARVTADQASEVGIVYEEQLAAPARAVLNHRQNLRQAIADYRSQNQI